MRKQILLFAILAVTAAVSITGCKKKETVDLTGIHTPETTSAAETMEPTTEAPKIEIELET